MQIADGFEFEDAVTGLKLKVVKGERFNILHVEIGEPAAPNVKNRDFWFNQDGTFDGTGSGVGC